MIKAKAVKDVMFRIESFEQLLKTFNELDDAGKKKALEAMGSIYKPQAEQQGKDNV